MSGSALGLGALLRCPTVLQLRPTAFLFFYFLFFYTRQLEERKRMGEREKF
jgi:SNF family Na+-dependent transporter